MSSLTPENEDEVMFILGTSYSFKFGVFLGGVINLSSVMLDSSGGVENFLCGIDKFETGLTIKLNEVSLRGDKTLSVDSRLQFEICKGTGVNDEMFGEPTALTSLSGEKT